MCMHRSIQGGGQQDGLVLVNHEAFQDDRIIKGDCIPMMSCCGTVCPYVMQWAPWIPQGLRYIKPHTHALGATPNIIEALPRLVNDFMRLFIVLRIIARRLRIHYILLTVITGAGWASPSEWVDIITPCSAECSTRRS